MSRRVAAVVVYVLAPLWALGGLLVALVTHDFATVLIAMLSVLPIVAAAERRLGLH